MKQNQKMPEDGVAETPFNMAMLFYYRINKIMDVKDNASIMGNLALWYSSLRSIYRNVKFKIDPDGKKFQQCFDDVKDNLKSSVQGRIGREIEMINQSRASEQLDLIDSKLMIEMDKKNMIFPKINTKGLDELKKRYGL